MNLVVLILLATLASAVEGTEADLGRYSDWAEGPVSWLLTEDEAAAWSAVDSEESAARFIEEFWSRRDPVPSTPGNEARHLFRQRQADADLRFSIGKRVGSMTDRGRVLLLLGAPNAIAEIPTDGQKPPTEIWFWEGENLPAGADEQSVSISFVDEYGTGNFKVSLFERARVEELLDRAKIEFFEGRVAVATSPKSESMPGDGPAAEIVELEEPAREFRSAELREAWEEFDPANDRPDIHLAWGEFMTSAGQYYVSLQLYVPASARLDTIGDLTFFGAVTDRSGEIVAVVEEPARLQVTRTDAYLDRTLPLRPGDYLGTFGLSKGGSPIAMVREELSLDPLLPGEPDVSRLFLSNNVFPLIESVPATAPFAFGGMKVVPKGDSRFKPRDVIWYAIELRNPGLDEEGRPRVRLQLMVEGETADGAPVRMGVPNMVTNPHLMRNQPGRFLVGGSFARGALGPGRYQLDLQLIDDVSGRTWEKQTEFEIVAE